MGVYNGIESAGEKRKLGGLVSAAWKAGLDCDKSPAAVIQLLTPSIVEWICASRKPRETINGCSP